MNLGTNREIERGYIRREKDLILLYLELSIGLSRGEKGESH